MTPTRGIERLLTDIKQDCAVELFVNNMFVEGLVIECARSIFGCRYFVGVAVKQRESWIVLIR